MKRWAAVRSVAPSTGRRDLRIDAVRGVALVLMYLAHCAPSPGPAKVLNLSEYATYPLFALLVGIGAALGSRSASRRWWVGPLVRGAVLVAVGEVLERQHTQVWIVLGFLGVLTWLAAPLARARPAVVAGIGLMALGLAPWLNDRATWTPNEFGLTGLQLARFLVVGGPDVAGYPYQLASMVFFAAVGILLSHYLLGADVGDRRRLAIGVACGFASAGWLALEQAGVFEMVPYDVSYRVLLFDALLIVAITLVVATLAARVRGLAAPLAAMGAMSLTLYCLQIAWLSYDARVLHPGLRADSWLNVAVLIAGSMVFALAWRAAVRVEPWRRGPIEGPVAVMVRSLTPERTRA